MPEELMPPNEEYSAEPLRHVAGRIEETETPSPDAPMAEIQATCWRCGKPVPAGALQCAICRAGVVREAIQPRGHREPGVRSPIEALVWVYAGLLATSVVYGWVVHFGLSPLSENRRDNARVAEVIVESVDAVFLLVALTCMQRAPALKLKSGKQRLAAWIVFLPALIVMFGLNLGYHWVLYQFFPAVGQRVEEFSAGRILLTCVEPALVEELFFRYIALGTLRMVLGTHGAVFVSAVMFGMAHIFALPSIPLFILVGLFLGYARVLSGGIALPICLHFLHNFAILLLNSGAL
jgi:membrane protease YdiL (CAAX protease family)